MSLLNENRKLTGQKVHIEIEHGVKHFDEAGGYGGVDSMNS